MASLHLQVFSSARVLPSLLAIPWRNAEHLLFPLTSEGVAGTQHLWVVTHGHQWVLQALNVTQLVGRGSGPRRGSGKVHDKLWDRCTSVKETKIGLFQKTHMQLRLQGCWSIKELVVLSWNSHHSVDVKKVSCVWILRDLTVLFRRRKHKIP